MKSETAVIPLTPARPKSSATWKAVLVLIPIVTVIMLLWLRQVQVQSLGSRVLSSYGSVPPFEFTDQNDQPFGSTDLAGKIWIADFIFTTCPGPCPIISTRMSELQKPLEKTDVQLVSFTVDPERDTPEVLRSYAEKLHARTESWHFLTGLRTTIYSLIENGFKLAVSDGSEQTGMPIHSTRVVLIDRRGVIRGYYDALAPDAVTKLAADANHLFREQPK
jgi:cytochrome oxidase Cu insertion factor (SCO1/SenC/PrrC family)